MSPWHLILTVQDFFFQTPFRGSTSSSSVNIVRSVIHSWRMSVLSIVSLRDLHVWLWDLAIKSNSNLCHLSLLSPLEARTVQLERRRCDDLLTLTFGLLTVQHFYHVWRSCDGYPLIINVHFFLNFARLYDPEWPWALTFVAQSDTQITLVLKTCIVNWNSVWLSFFSCKPGRDRRTAMRNAVFSLADRIVSVLGSWRPLCRVSDPCMLISCHTPDVLSIPVGTNASSRHIRDRFNFCRQSRSKADIFFLQPYVLRLVLGGRRCVGSRVGRSYARALETHWRH